jgi:hydroxymethylpyrimidine/phosphomethylpyrimidine kinase
MVNVAMTIAGSDSGGGAGIQADLKTFQELGVFGTSAITAITVQNTHGVTAIQAMEPSIISAQIKAVTEDFTVKAIKTGMLFSAEIIHAVADSIRDSGILLVVDPVMIAKGGASLLHDEAVEALKSVLLPIATVVTPNIPEAEVLTGLTIKTDKDIEEAAEHILALGAKAVVIKGGHRQDAAFAEDMFMSKVGTKFSVRSSWVNTKDTHGTGCTYAAALTAFLANGEKLEDAVVSAKHFIHAAIEDGLTIGGGHGPTNHWAYGRRMKNEKLIEGVAIIG